MPTLSRAGGSLAVRGGARKGATSMKGGSRSWCAPGRSRARTPATSRGLTSAPGRRRERALDGAMAEARVGPGRGAARGSLRRSHRDCRGRASRSAQPVGLAVVAVIGEPEVEALGMAGRQHPPARNQPCRLPPARGVRARDGRMRPVTPDGTRLNAGLTTRWADPAAAGGRGRAPSRDRPRCVGLSGGLSGVCNSTRMGLLRGARRWRALLVHSLPSERGSDPVDASVEGKARVQGLGGPVRRDGREDPDSHRRASAIAS